MNDKVKKISLFCLSVLLMLPVQDSVAQNSGGGHHLRTIVIDPGHGGKDPGAPGPDSRNSEKHIVLAISKLLGEKIKAEYPSVKVVYTRSGDTFKQLTERIKIAHDNNADLFISIHCNSSKSKSVSGSSAHILSRKDSRNPNRDLFNENLELTKLENSVIEFEEDKSSYSDTAEDQILNALLFHANFDHSVLFAQLVVENLACSPFRKWGTGLHQNDFHLLKKMTCPAILVETAFLSNSNERQLLVSEKWQNEIADRLFKAFKEYKTVYDASVSPSAEPAEPARGDSADVPVLKSEGIAYYSIQIMGLGRLLKNGDPALKGLDVQAVKGEGSNIYKYVCGRYGTYETAAAQLQTVRKKFPEAFVVKIENEKITKVR